MKEKIETIDISWKTILKVLSVIVIIYVLIILKDIIGWIMLALVISFLVNPLIDKMKMNRVFSSVVVYSFIILIFILFIYFIFPPLVMEAQSFADFSSGYLKNFPNLLSDLGIDSLKNISTLIVNLKESLINISSNVLNIFTSLFGSIFAGITVFTLALFFSIEKMDIIRGIKMITPEKFEEQVLSKWERIQHHVVGWFGSRIIACIFIGLTTFLFCLALNIKFALMWGLLSGLLNIIPMIGPIVAGIFLGLFVLITSIPKAIIVVFLAILFQQIESYILMPILTKKITGIPTSLVLISILVGGVFWGILGVILSIPIAGLVFEGVKEYLESKKA
jgi:predicted PurR-regulated permease PerM